MRFTFGGVDYEAWIETTKDGKRLREHLEETINFGEPTPHVQCYAQCVIDREFSVNVRSCHPGGFNLDYEATLKINGSFIYTYIVASDADNLCFDHMKRGRDTAQALCFAPMEHCTDVDELPKNLDSVGTIELTLQPGRVAWIGQGHSPHISESPSQKAKPLQAKQSSTVSGGAQTSTGIEDLYRFAPFDGRSSAARISLTWKYSTLSKLRILKVVGEPKRRSRLERPTVRRSQRMATRRRAISISDDEVTSPVVPSNAQLAEEQRRHKATQNKLRRVQRELNRALGPREVIDLTEG